MSKEINIGIPSKGRLRKDILKIFKKNGYITNIDSPNCKYFVGKKECTKELLINNGME